jgi:hypothetical protein
MSESELMDCDYLSTAQQSPSAVSVRWGVFMFAFRHASDTSMSS